MDLGEAAVGGDDRMPLGVSPNGNDFLPSGAVTSENTISQVPTIWSFRLCAVCAAAAPADKANASQAAAMVRELMVSDPRICWRGAYHGVRVRATRWLTRLKTLLCLPCKRNLETRAAAKQPDRQITQNPVQPFAQKYSA